MDELLSFVESEFVESGAWLDNINPRNGARISRVSEASDTHVDRAVRSAKRAAETWGRASVSLRSDFLLAIAAGIESRFDEFVQAESLDTGKPIAQAKSLDIPRAISNLRFFAALIQGETSDSFVTTANDTPSALNYTIRKPHGVVGVICPWNLPLLLLTWKIAPALATGNAVIIKPSEHTPTSATLLAQVVADIGAPECSLTPGI